MADLMLSLVYTSRALIEAAARARVLDDLRACSIARNSALDITGILIATPWHFAELLEGPNCNIEAVMASILADPRHCDVRIARRSGAERILFPTWQIARFDGEDTGAGSVGQLLAAVHQEDDGANLRKLDRLFQAIALDRVGARL